MPGRIDPRNRPRFLRKASMTPIVLEVPTSAFGVVTVVVNRAAFHALLAEACEIAAMIHAEEGRE
jgi:hypothetical protein